MKFPTENKFSTKFTNESKINTKFEFPKFSFEKNLTK